MATGLYNWSRTPANNASATYTWAEGMAPSAVNDSARGIMSDVAQWRDDIAGALVTGGTSTNYTLTSYSNFSSLAAMNGQMVAFTPHTTSGATVTLNVDGLGAKPLRSAPAVELLSGTLIQGTPYLALYSSSDSAWYLHGFYGNAYNVPLLGGLDYWDTVAPNSSFIFPAGQAISRTTYSAAFARWGTTYGVGDGSTTFNVPDKTGRVSAMKEATATRLTTAGGGVDGATMGSASSAQNGTILQANLPAVTLVTTIIDPGHDHSIDVGSSGGGSTQVTQGTPGTSSTVTGPVNSNTTGITASTALGGSGTAFKLVQPTIICNYIIRII